MSASRIRVNSFFQGKRLGERVCKNYLLEVKLFLVLWQTKIKPADLQVQQLGMELNNFALSQVPWTFVSREQGWWLGGSQAPQGTRG